MGKDKDEKKKKGKKGSSAPKSPVPSVDDEAQQQQHGSGAHGTSQGLESTSPQTPTDLAESVFLGKETPYAHLFEMPSAASRFNPVPEISHLDVTGSDSDGSEPSSPSKNIFSKIKNIISPKKKSPNKSASHCTCKSKKNHSPDCPDWVKWKPDAEHNSPSRTFDFDFDLSVFGGIAHSHDGSNPITEGSDNAQLRRTSGNNRLSVPTNSAVSSSPPRRSSLSRVKVSPGKKMATFFPVSDCNCADKCNHDKGCPEKSQEIEVKLEDAKKISTSSSASPTMLDKNKDGDSSNTSSAEIKIKERGELTESSFSDLSIWTGLEKNEEELEESFQKNCRFVFMSHQRYRANRNNLENRQEASTPDEENKAYMERLDELSQYDRMIVKNEKLPRRRSRSFGGQYVLGNRDIFSPTPQPQVKSGDDLGAKGATGGSSQSTRKCKKLMRQDAIDVHDQLDSEPHCTDQFDRRLQRAQLTAAPERSDPSIGQQVQSVTDTQLGATAASSVRSKLSSTQLGARPKIRNVAKKDVGCPQSTSIGSESSVVQSTPESCRSPAMEQQLSSPPRSDPTRIPSDPTNYRGAAKEQLRTTPPKSDPSAIPSDPMIYRSATMAQPRTTPSRLEPSLIPIKLDISRSPAMSQPLATSPMSDPPRIPTDPMIYRGATMAQPRTTSPRSEPSLIPMKLDISRSPAMAQPRTTPPRSDQSRIPMKLDISRSPAMSQPLATSPMSDPTRIPTDPMIYRGATMAQPRTTPTRSEPSRIPMKLDISRSPAMSQPLATSPMSDPPRIPTDPMIYRSATMAQPRTTPTRSEPSLIPIKLDISRSPAMAQPRTTPPRSDESRIPSNSTIFRSAAREQPLTTPPRSETPRVQIKLDICQSPAIAQTLAIPPSSDHSRIQSKQVICRSPAMALMPPRSDPTCVPSKPEICQSTTSESLTTTPSSDPSIIQDEPTVQITDESDAVEQQCAATGGNETLPELTDDEVQSLSEASESNLSLRRHVSAPPIAPSAFGACLCGNRYFHPVGCSREIRARQSRMERRCKIEVENIKLERKKMEEKFQQNSK